MMTMPENGLKEHTNLIAEILEALLVKGHVDEALGRIDLLMHGLGPNFDNLLSILSV